ncbi:MAG: substrate-binding periplasmic protein [Neptuniibacter sp.]
MQVLVRLISSVILLFIFAGSANAEKIVLAADEWCPFNCKPVSSKPGFMIEVATQVFSEQGHTVEYKVMSWSRAIREARVGNINGIIGAFKGDAPDFIYPDQELSILSNTFFVRKDSQWKFKNVSSLKEVQLAAIAGYDYGDELRDYIQNNQTDQVSLLNGQGQPLAKAIKLLHKKRVDALIEADPVFWYTAQTLGLQDQFKTAGRSNEPEHSYITFSPALPTSKNYAQILSAGIESLRANGDLARILSKYGLSDWRK